MSFEILLHTNTAAVPVRSTAPALATNVDSVQIGAEPEEDFECKHYCAAQLDVMKSMGVCRGDRSAAGAWLNRHAANFEQIVKRGDDAPSLQQALLSPSSRNAAVHDIRQRLLDSPVA